MSIKKVLLELSQQVEISPDNKSNIIVNFDLNTKESKELFHISIDEAEIQLLEGESENALGLLQAREESLQAILDLGIDPVSLVMKYSIPAGPESIELPDIEESLYLETESPSGHPIQFNVFIENDQLNIIEGEDLESDIQVRIKSSYLPKLMSDKPRISMALLTGKIKISNMGGLIKLLAKLGLKL